MWDIGGCAKKRGIFLINLGWGFFPFQLGFLSFQLGREPGFKGQDLEGKGQGTFQGIWKGLAPEVSELGPKKGVIGSFKGKKVKAFIRRF